jgi:hypothetical protein
MFRKGLILAALAAAFFPAIAKADFQQGDLELTLGGSANGGRDFDGFAAGINASLGYFATDQLELGIRQSLNYNDVSSPPNAGGQLNGSTRIFGDFHFDMGAWQPFIGVNIGYVYGDGVADTWEAAPEGGVKYFLNSTTFVFAQVEYQFFFDKAGDLDSSFDDGQFVYSLGLGVKF